MQTQKLRCGLGLCCSWPFFGCPFQERLVAGAQVLGNSLSWKAPKVRWLKSSLLMFSMRLMDSNISSILHSYFYCLHHVFFDRLNPKDADQKPWWSPKHGSKSRTPHVLTEYKLCWRPRESLLPPESWSDSNCSFWDPLPHPEHHLKLRSCVWQSAASEKCCKDLSTALQSWRYAWDYIGKQREDNETAKEPAASKIVLEASRLPPNRQILSSPVQVQSSQLFVDRSEASA